jgi:hypothetical protein
MHPKRATREQLAEHLDMSVRRLAVLISEGVVPPPGDDRRHDLDAARFAYLDHLRQRVVERTGSYSP